MAPGLASCSGLNGGAPSMLVLNLACESGHAFEGWFASSDDCSDQQARGLLSCPMCGSSRVERRPSAPRLNVSHLRAETPAPPRPTKDIPVDADTDASSRDAREALQAVWMALSRELARQAEDVGDRFADEARRIHYGDAEERAIRGRSQPEEVRALIDEGIELVPLLLPQGADGELH